MITSTQKYTKYQESWTIMNHSNAMNNADLPLVIEFNSQPKNAADYDADNEWFSSKATSEQEFFGNCNDNIQVEREGRTTTAEATDDNHDREVPDVVSQHELDAMKRMVFEMRRYPELLHHSPVYSKSVQSLRLPYSMMPQMNSGIEDSHLKSTLARQKSSSSALDVSDRTYETVMVSKEFSNSFATPVSQKDSLYYCPECRTSGSRGGNGMSSHDPLLKLTAPSRPSQRKSATMLISNFPPMPFS